MTRTLTILLVGTFLVFSYPSVSEAAEVYRRATVLEDRIGRVHVRAAYGVRLTVLTDCDSNPRGCPEERVYPEVLSLGFVSEHREATGDEVVRTEESAGTILVALGLSHDGLGLFRRELFDRLRRLSAPAFAQPFAGWGWNMLPFDVAPTARSELPAWICFDSGERIRTTRYQRYVEDVPDGSETHGGGSHTYADPPTPVCEEMAAATEGSYPEVVETLPVPARQREVTVYHEDVVLIDTEDVTLLAELPEGVRVFKREFPKDISASRSGARAGVSFASMGGGGWRFDAYAAEAVMPIEALDRNAWLHRWRVETVERQLGPDPRDNVVGDMTLYVAYLATMPPAALAEEGDDPKNFGPPGIEIPEGLDVPAEGPAEIDRTAFLSDSVDRLHRHYGAPAELIAKLVAVPDAGLKSDGWISVLCRDDGSATYYLPPTNAQNGLTNADLFCAAVESRLAAAR